MGALFFDKMFEIFKIFDNFICLSREVPTSSDISAYNYREAFMTPSPVLGEAEYDVPPLPADPFETPLQQRIPSEQSAFLPVADSQPSFFDTQIPSSFTPAAVREASSQPFAQHQPILSISADDLAPSSSAPDAVPSPSSETVDMYNRPKMLAEMPSSDEVQFTKRMYKGYEFGEWKALRVPNTSPLLNIWSNVLPNAKPWKVPDDVLPQIKEELTLPIEEDVTVKLPHVGKKSGAASKEKSVPEKAITVEATEDPPAATKTQDIREAPREREDDMYPERTETVPITPGYRKTRAEIQRGYRQRHKREEEQQKEELRETKEQLEKLAEESRLTQTRVNDLEAKLENLQRVRNNALDATRFLLSIINKSSDGTPPGDSVNSWLEEFIKHERENGREVVAFPFSGAPATLPKATLKKKKKRGRKHNIRNDVFSGVLDSTEEKEEAAHAESKKTKQDERSDAEYRP